MANWSPKDPGDVADYWFDWSTFLPAAQSISSASVTVPSGITSVDLTLHFSHLFLKCTQYLGRLYRLNENRNIKNFIQVYNRRKPAVGQITRV